MSEVQKDADDKPLDKYEESAKIFGELAEVFRKKVYKLSQRKRKAPVRVLEALLFTPLENIELVGNEEKELAYLCNQIIAHKKNLIEYTFNRIEEKKDEQKK